jgi:hypothetical protein
MKLREIRILSDQSTDFRRAATAGTGSLSDQ